MSNDSQIILYQPDETFALEVRMDKDTVWLSQLQMAELFRVKVPAISKHINNIYEEGELERNSTISNLETVRNEGGCNALEKHNAQYATINKIQLPHKIHDRFLIIDHQVYLLGTSLKDMGHTLSVAILTGFTPEEILQKLK